MKYLLSIVLVVFLLIQLSAQNKEVNTIEYLLPVSFDKIDIPGKLFLKFKDGIPGSESKDSIVQNMIKIDSSGYNYDLIFTKASIGTIEQSRYTLKIRHDTLTSVIVMVDNIHNLGQLLLESKKQFGEPYINVEKKGKTYEWKKTGNSYLPVLSVARNQKEGILTITMPGY